jgi:hypothetical protein
MNRGQALCESRRRGSGRRVAAWAVLLVPAVAGLSVFPRLSQRAVDWAAERDGRVLTLTTSWNDFGLPLAAVRRGRNAWEDTDGAGEDAVRRELEGVVVAELREGLNKCALAKRSFNNRAASAMLDGVEQHVQGAVWYVSPVRLSFNVAVWSGALLVIHLIRRSRRRALRQSRAGAGDMRV